MSRIDLLDELKEPKKLTDFKEFSQCQKVTDYHSLNLLTVKVFFFQCNPNYFES